MYPDATEGLIEFVGVKVVEQLEDDCPNTGIMKELSSTAVLEQNGGDIVKDHTQGTESSSITYNKAIEVGRCSFIAEEQEYKVPAVSCIQAMDVAVQSILPLCRMAKVGSSRVRGHHLCQARLCILLAWVVSVRV